MDNDHTTIICRDCGDTFTLTAGEIDFFALKGLHQPRRCKPCRQYRRAEQAQGDSFGPESPWR